MTAWWDPAFAKLCRGVKEGRSGNSPVPAHMGAWPEREAPAGRFALVHLTVEKGEGFVLPLFLILMDSAPE